MDQTMLVTLTMSTCWTARPVQYIAERRDLIWRRSRGDHTSEYRRNDITMLVWFGLLRVTKGSIQRSFGVRGSDGVTQGPSAFRA